MKQSFIFSPDNLQYNISIEENKYSDALTKYHCHMIPVNGESPPFTFGFDSVKFLSDQTVFVTSVPLRERAIDSDRIADISIVI